MDSLYVRSAQNRKQKFTGLSLQPGEEVDLIWETFGLSFSSDPAGLSIDLCIWTSHPDNRLDTDASNDTHCADFLVNEEEEIIQHSISIFPSPTSDFLNIHISSPQIVGDKTIFRIVDVNGRILQNINAGNSQANYILSVSNWAAGVYFLQYMEDGEIQTTQRFVVVK